MHDIFKYAARIDKTMVARAKIWMWWLSRSIILNYSQKFKYQRRVPFGSKRSRMNFRQITNARDPFTLFRRCCEVTSPNIRTSRHIIRKIPSEAFSQDTLTRVPFERSWLVSRGLNLFACSYIPVNKNNEQSRHGAMLQAPRVSDVPARNVCFRRKAPSENAHSSPKDVFKARPSENIGRATWLACKSETPNHASSSIALIVLMCAISRKRSRDHLRKYQRLIREIYVRVWGISESLVEKFHSEGVSPRKWIIHNLQLRNYFSNPSSDIRNIRGAREPSQQ